MAALYRLEDNIETGELLQVWVSREHRGTSVARDLMEAVFQWAGENNFARIIAGVKEGNDRAARFYARQGFSMMEEFANDVYWVKEMCNNGDVATRSQRRPNKHFAR